MSATVDIRSRVMPTFLCASAGFARRARQIEIDHPVTIDEVTRFEHRGLVTAAIMQTVAALEAESWEITMFGPGNHLGSDSVDTEALSFLQPLAQVIDREPVLDRYEMILHLLQKERLDRGAEPWQATALLVKLRNELVHYKAKWGNQMKTQRLFNSLQQLRLSPPSFANDSANFFPHRCLSASCAKWAVSTATEFLTTFYDRLGIASPLLPYEEQLRDE